MIETDFVFPYVYICLVICIRQGLSRHTMAYTMPSSTTRKGQLINTRLVCRVKIVEKIWVKGNNEERYLAAANIINIIPIIARIIPTILAMVFAQGGSLLEIE